MNGTIASRLGSKRRAFLDTNAVIYFLEEHPDYLPLVDPVFQRIASASLRGITSYVTFLEVLVQPLRLNRHAVAARYRDYLLHTDGLDVFPLDRAVAERAAGIRARHAIRTPDSIQLAVALEQGADVIVSNDRDFKTFKEIEVLMLKDFVGKN